MPLITAAILSVGVTAYTIATIPRSMRDTTIDDGQSAKGTEGVAAMKESEILLLSFFLIGSHN